MARYSLFTDGTCDIPDRYKDTYEINILPMKIIISSQTLEFADGWTKARHRAFYDRLRSGEVATTTQITPFEYQEAFEKHLSKGSDVLYICFSSGLSDTIQSARLAERDLREKYPNRRVMIVDSKSVSVGMGMLLLRAGENREKGMSIEDNARDIERVVSEGYAQWFTVDDLVYLARSGRLNTLSAIMGSALHIKPIIEVAGGRLVTRDKVAGRKSSIKALVKKAAELAGGRRLKRVFIPHADAPDAARAFKAQLEKAIDAEEMLEMELSPMIGAHVGPGLVSFFFMD